MKIRSISALFLFGIAAKLAVAQTPPPTVEPASAYEELPELKASEILRDDILTGPYHHVREEVPPFGRKSFHDRLAVWRFRGGWK